MDVDETKPEVPKTATLAPGSMVQPKRTLDLESMAFRQGGHLFPRLTTFKASSGPDESILLRADTGAGKTSVTRKSTDTGYTNLVRIIIIDEIRDESGPVLENIESVAWSKLTSICDQRDCTRIDFSRTKAASSSLLQWDIGPITTVTFLSWHSHQLAAYLRRPTLLSILVPYPPLAATPAKR